jgi:hypothetical protein
VQSFKAKRAHSATTRKKNILRSYVERKRQSEEKNMPKE